MSSKVKEIIRYICVLITIVFTFCFSVSCDSDVITSNNNRYAYTEVLLSNGTFSYKGRSYDFLSDVIKEIRASGTQEEPVRLTGNILSRPVSIPENLDVEIDLGGYQIKFFDVDDSAVKVSDSAKLHLENGTLLLNSKDRNLTVLDIEGANSRIHLKENVYIEGAVVVSDNAELLMANNLSDIRMKNAHLVVEGAGMAVVTSVDGDTNTFAESPQATIVDKSGEIEPTDVEEGYWYITRGEVFHVYGSLKEAIESLEADDEVINLIANEETGIPAEILLKQSITLNLNTYTTGIQNITLADNVDLEINGEGMFIGSITSEGEENSTLTVTGANLNSSVEISGDVTLKNVGGTYELPITSTNGSIVIDNSDADRNFGGGAITAKEDVILEGHPISVGEVKAASLEATSVTEIGNVDVSESLVSSGSTFVGTVNATTITDGSSTTFGSVFKGNITASEDISLTGSSFNSGTTTAPSVTSENGDVNMENVSGTAGAITAKEDVVLKGYYHPILVGEVTAASLTATSVTEIGNVDVTESLVSSGSTFVGMVNATTITDDNTAGAGSVFKGNITASEDISLTGSSFNSGATTAPSVTSENGNINMNKVSGTAGAITAKEDVVLIGCDHPISVGEVKATTLTATSVTEIGNVDVSECLVSSGSTFVGTVNASTIIDENTVGAGSVFKGDITASEDISLTGSSFNGTTALSITSASGDVNLTNVSGTVGAITANGADGSGNISVDNSASSEALNTGAITAANKADIKGKTGSLTVDIRGNVYADEISIKDAHISATGIAKGKSGDIYTPAGSVTIENPINASGPSYSYIGNLYADELTVSAPGVGVTLEVGKAFVSGDNTESTVSGGFYDKFTHNGEGNLTINKGYFYDFTHSNGSEANTLNGGTFLVVGTSSDNGFAEINNLIDMVGSNGNISIISKPQTNKTNGEYALVSLPVSASFNNVPNGGNVTLYFDSMTDSQTEVLKGGWVVDTVEATNKTTAFTFGNGITVTGSVYVGMGDTVNSNLDLINTTAGQRVFKLKSDNKISSSVSEKEVGSGYEYGPQVGVVFHSNYDQDKTVLKFFEYDTALELPTADSMNIKREYYEVDYWTASAVSTEPVYNDGANVTIKADTELYAHWKETGVLIKFASDGNLDNISKTEETYKLGLSFGADEQGTAKGLPTVTSSNDYIFLGWTLGNNIITNETIVTTDYRNKTFKVKSARTNSVNVPSIILTTGPVYDKNANNIGGALSGNIYYGVGSGVYAIDYGSPSMNVTIREQDSDLNLPSFLTEEQMNKIQTAIIALSKVTGTTAYKAYDAERYFIISGSSGSWTNTKPSSFKSLWSATSYGAPVTESVIKSCARLIGLI